MAYDRKVSEHERHRQVSIQGDNERGVETRGVHSIDAACKTKGRNDIWSVAAVSQEKIGTSPAITVRFEFLTEMIDL